MQQQILLETQRLIICKLMLRLIHESTDAGGAKWRGSAADDVLLLAGIYIGHAEGRPMKATKLAEYVHMPRPTVVRKLQEMQRLGFIELAHDGSARCRVDVFNSEPVLAAVNRLTQAIQKAAAELSKMDNMDVAQK